MVANQNYSKIPFHRDDILFLKLPISFNCNEEDLSSTLNIGQANKPIKVISSLLSSKFSL